MNIKEFEGKVFTDIKVNKDKTEITFTDTTGKVYEMYHSQDCCETVHIEDICGDLKDLLNTPIVVAYETSQRHTPYGVEEPEYADDSCTWTFYHIRTVKGTVTLRWYGTSNGYYSEEVSIEERTDN